MFDESQARRTKLFKSIDSSNKGGFVKEVTVALSKLEGDKVLGLNGFSMAFWKFCWPRVGREVMHFFEEFHSKNSMARSLNATFLVLIHKKGDM